MAPVGVYVACRCIVGLCGVVGCVWVSIITREEKYKANPLRKRKKNLTRGLKKSILNLRGVKNFYEKIEKCVFIGIG